MNMRVLAILLFFPLLHRIGAQEGLVSIQCCAATNFTDHETNLIWTSDNYLFHSIGRCAHFSASPENFNHKSTRIFYEKDSKSFCYYLPVIKGQDYLLRATFLNTPIPLFGTAVTFNFSIGATSISQISASLEFLEVEGVFAATNDHTNFCLLSEDGNAFISKVELRPLNDAFYLQGNQSTILKLVSRVDLGSWNVSYRFPKDLADRIWFVDHVEAGFVKNKILKSPDITLHGSNISIPIEVLQTAITDDEQLVFHLKDLVTEHDDYLIILYFLELDANVQTGQRVFDIYVNGNRKHANFDILENENSSNYKVFISRMESNGFLNISLVKVPDTAKYGPICNAYEIYQVLPRNTETIQTDVNAVMKLKDELILKNSKHEVFSNWHGDPCWPAPWNGLTCEEKNGAFIITKLDLPSKNLHGTFHSVIGALTELKELDVQHDDFTGSILNSHTSLPNLSKLSVQYNPQLNSEIPSRLSTRKNLTVMGGGSDAAHSQKTNVHVIGSIAGGSLAVSFALGIVFSCCYKRPRRTLKRSDAVIKNSEFKERSFHYPLKGPQPDVKTFTLEYIKKATSCYQTLIGEGGFGKVFRGTLPHGQEIAVKVRSATSVQGTREFDNEVNLLSKLKHENLVPLLGYCCENEQQILVYPFMSNGSLQERLYGEALKRKVLDWPTRLTIALGAARGLLYLHTFPGRCIIHRDVKSSNILLDQSMCGNVADFGFSKYAPQEGDSAASLEVRGTAGYLDPEYYSTQQLSTKSDVFSFGVDFLRDRNSSPVPMAVASQSQAVKCLNTSNGRRRFVFKSFSQRVEEIDIDVFRSLEPVRSEPKDGSSFFLEALMYWKELNTAEDFISFYEAMLPLVQSLPQILLHKESIFCELIGRLQMGAKLSLEPILMLIVAFSRDVLEDFLPFLQRLAGSLTNLFLSGGDRDPDMLEQVFTAWSYIVMYLHKYLVKDVITFLTVTIQLRYYRKDYIQEFMAEAVSFLLRNAPFNQLKLGIRKIIQEVVKCSSSVRKSGATALLWHSIKGTSSRLHSRASKVLLLLFDESFLTMSGSEAVLEEVLTGVLHRLCEETGHKEQSLVYECLFECIHSSMRKGCIAHVNQLLTLLTTAICLSHGGEVFDRDKMLDFVRLLMLSYMTSVDKSQDSSSEVSVPVFCNKVLQLVLCLLDTPQSYSYAQIILECAPSCKLERSSLLMLVKGLVLKDPQVLLSCRTYIISSFDELIETSPDEVLFLMLTFFERQSCHILDGIPPKISKFFKNTISYWVNLLGDVTSINDVSDLLSKLTILWAVIRCYPYFEHTEENTLSITDFIDYFDQLLETDAGDIAGVPVSVWQDLLAATLKSHNKLLHGNSGPSEAYNFLSLAKRHKSSRRILCAVADYLDIVLGSKNEAGGSQGLFSEIDVEDARISIGIFADNVALPNKEIRISTLRILSHIILLDEPPSSEECHNKKNRHEEFEAVNDLQCFNVVSLLLSIETTPISVTSSRAIVILISRLQMALTSRKINDAYVPLLLNGVIGILHNRFSPLWDPALVCLTTLIGRYRRTVWNQFFQHLEFYQQKSLSVDSAALELKSETPPNTLAQSFNKYIAHVFDSTPCIRVMTLLLQALQKIPDIAESHSCELIPLFFKFLGYTDGDTFSVELFSEYGCKGKEWRSLLKEWLNLLKLMHNSQSLYRNQVLKEVLVNRLLNEIDPDIQLKVIDCLLNWKDDYLIQYDKHLKNLIISKNLREELTTWAISKDSEYIKDGHRAQLIPVIVRLLTPKVKKLKILASSKHAGMKNRRAILCFLTQLEVDELHLFFSLLLKPLLCNHHGTEVLNEHTDAKHSKFADQWKSLVPSNISIYQAMDNLSLKKKYGFLYALEDILKTFDALHIKPFLSSLMMFVALILEDCMLNIKNEGNSKCWASGNGSGDLKVDDAEISAQNSLVMSKTIKQFKDLRSLCLKIIYSALSKHDCHDFGCEFWDMFFSSVKPLIESFKNEGSSSEKPSSLFSCFLAMSRSPKLVSFLNREASLVPSIFSILTVRTASDAIISSVLNFIENLLNLDNDFDEEDDSIKSVFYPHLEVLIHSFHELFQIRGDANRKRTIWPGKTDLRIFKMIVKFIKGPLIAVQFLEILLPIFKKKNLDFDDCSEALYVIKGILQHLTSEGDKTSGKILKAIHPILAVARLDLRLCVCDIVNSLSLINPSLTNLATLLLELNAVSSTEVGELDYDRRVSAYETIRPDLFFSLGKDGALPILSHCLYDISSDELILRQCASKSLLAFVQFASSYLKTGTKDSHTQDAECKEASRVTVVTGSITDWTNTCIQSVIKSVLLKNMGEAMTKNISIQKEWITLLHDMVYNLREIPALNTFRLLCSEDPEVDFFNNILHLQIHRRRRALQRFRNVISAGSFDENISIKIFVPLFFNMMFDVKEGKGEHIRDACLDSLASMSRQMQWESYRSFMMRCFREIIDRPEKQKILVRLICAILDMFHFYAANTCDLDRNDSHDAVCCDDHQGNLTSALQDKVSNRIIPSEIQIYLQKTVLPKILKLLSMDSEKVNVNISLAAVKLLKLLPPDSMDSQLSSIIHRICNFLKNRLESVRDEARSALAACTKELGLEYLYFIIKVLRATLKRGYEMHVLGYTLNFILSKTLTGGTTVSLDYCLEELLSIAENDILGDVAEEKEVEKIASKMKETRKSKSFETLRMISQNITFRTHAPKLLSPIHKHIDNHITPKTKRKIETMLFHIASGIECNPSVQTTELFIFVYGLIEGSTASEFSHSKEKSGALSNEKSSLDVIDKVNSLCTSDRALKNSHLISVFALGVLHNRIKNINLDKKDQQLLSMLDPFVKQLGDCLNSKYEDVLSAAFRCLAPLLKLPLPSLDVQADKIKTMLVYIAQRSGNGSSPLVQTCLKLLTMLLRSTRISISHGELHMLIQFPMFIDIQTSPSILALSLLKSIIARKLVVPEIYDIILRVAELMVTSESEPIRKKCSQILLQFLLDYRLSSKRLKQHMDFLMTNLSYEHPSGRESVLEMLHAILIKFPRSVIDSHAQTFFLHLVVSLANEHDQKVRSMVSTVLKELIGRTSQLMLQTILEYSLSWYFGEKQDIWSGAAQVIGLLIEVLTGRLKKHISGILQIARNILKVSIDAVDNMEPGFSSEPVVPFWKEAYYSLVMLEKMLLHYPELHFQLNFEEIWDMICKLLLHPHIWVRNISGRLLAMYFAAASETTRSDSEKMKQSALYLVNPCKLFVIAVSLLNQLEADMIDDASGNIITQNLTFSLCCLTSFANQSRPKPSHKFWAMLDVSEKRSYLEAFDLLGSRKAKRIFLLSTGGTSQSSSIENDHVSSDVSEGFQSLLIRPIFKRLGKIAVGKENAQMKITINCLRMITSQMGSDGSHDYAIHILLPLYKVCEGFTGKVITDEIKHLAEEVRDHIRDILGVDHFVQIYNQIRRNLKKKRDDRIQQQKLIAVINPMLHAKRKLRIAAKHRVNKRRKMEAIKIGGKRKR